MTYTVSRPLLGTPNIQFQCPNCHKEIEIPLPEAGQEFPCPHCGKTSITPDADELKQGIRDEAEVLNMLTNRKRQNGSSKLDYQNLKTVATILRAISILIAIVGGMELLYFLAAVMFGRVAENLSWAVAWEMIGIGISALVTSFCFYAASVFFLAFRDLVRNSHKK